MCAWLVTKPADPGKRVQSLFSCLVSFNLPLPACMPKICVAVATIAAHGFTTLARANVERGDGCLVLFGRRKACDLKRYIGTGPRGVQLPSKRHFPPPPNQSHVMHQEYLKNHMV